jgi:hypothetical protein
VVVLGNADAAVLAEAGGRRNYRDRETRYSDYNRATGSLRQPGSAMKPLVYLAAFEAGLGLDTLVPDEPIDGAVRKQRRGQVDQQLRRPVQGPDPDPAGPGGVAQRRRPCGSCGEVGVSPVIRAAKRMGIRSPLQPYLSTALGASEVRLLELADAYRAIASGVAAEPHVIDRVTDISGKELLCRTPGKAGDPLCGPAISPGGAPRRRSSARRHRPQPRRRRLSDPGDGQDRDDERLPGCLVRRVHLRAEGDHRGRPDRLRRQSSPREEGDRRARGAADLSRDHAPRLQGPARRPDAVLDRELLAQQAIEYDARRPKSVLELQKFRRTYVSRIADARGRTGSAELVNLNPRVNFWYLLRLTWDGEANASYHLTNSRPQTHDLLLDADFAFGLVLAGDQGRTRCDLWSSESPTSLAAANRLATPYVELCNEQVSLRRPTAGRRTSLEWATDFLRDNVWGGEKLTVLVRDRLYSDAHLMRSERISRAADTQEDGEAAGLPRPARLEAGHERDLVTPIELGLALAAPQARMRVGAWYATRENPGVFVSALEPGLASRSRLAAGPASVGRLDEVESKALTYLVAFDLSRFDVDFSIGTDHPRVNWSHRAQSAVRDDSLRGPDGIGDIAPLVAGGIIPHSLAERAVASFTGGFKRSHGAFRSGALGAENSGSHYGFVESGVVLSKLQPGLATIFVLDDGEVRMKTWSLADDSLLERIKFARQNGVPIVETDAATGRGVTGPLVARWGDGNWSGSEDRRLRSLRAGICLQESTAGRFLLYGYFSSATPSAMARVFLAYDCAYAMITDMNALEHTYLALYRVESSRLEVDHLIQGMKVLDKVVNGQTLPRFLGFADNRDFFYIVRRLSVAERTVQTVALDAAASPGTEAR